MTLMVSAREKIAYGLGDTASNFIFQSVMLFLTFYYTDVVGIPAAAVGTMFLVIRVMDAITDPLMGSLADATRTRWGAYRPYLMWLALPFALASVLAFTSPEGLNDSGKLVYAYATYAFLMLTYTAINIPYSALGGVMSAQASERVSIQAYRFVFAMVGGLIVTAFMLPLVDLLGQGDTARGYQLTMLLMGTVGMVLFLLCFAGTRERVKPAEPNMPSLTKQIRLLWRNDQCRILCAVAMLVLTGVALRNTMAIYYVKYALGLPELVTQFITAGMLGSIVGCALAIKCSQKIGKVRLYIWLQVASALICLSNFFIPLDAPDAAITLQFIWGLVFQMSTPLLWAKIADVVDYGEFKTGVRMTGVTYSTVVFFIKVGLATGGALAGWLLALYNYQPGISNTQVAQGIVMSFCLGPALASLAVAYLMRGYALNNNRLDEIQQKLASGAQSPYPERPVSHSHD